jgi:hypothetical protein
MRTFIILKTKGYHDKAIDGTVDLHVLRGGGRDPSPGGVIPAPNFDTTMVNQ